MTSALVAIMPVQALTTEGVGAIQPKPVAESRVKVEATRLDKNATLARNTTAKVSEPTARPEAAKTQTHDKKALSRCWKRLMDMVREVNHAQRNRK